MFGEIAVDGGLQVDDRMKTAATDAFAGQHREEIFDRIQPRPRGRREMEGPARMPCQPFFDLRMLVSGVVVDHRLDLLAGRNVALDGLEEADELLVPMALHAASDDIAVEHVESRENGVVP